MDAVLRHQDDGFGHPRRRSPSFHTRASPGGAPFGFDDEVRLHGDGDGDLLGGNDRLAGVDVLGDAVRVPVHSAAPVLEVGHRPRGLVLGPDHVGVGPIADLVGLLGNGVGDARRRSQVRIAFEL
ncbi:hypothetical protein AQF52_0097 [Streptomyces venezuelae]|nr:hypothetical protein AQF52_0097 [Streptomyces venezuelae]CUM44121.1 hypothetical protein BN2537_17207 [Streptomyces venezuelae]